jgi:hypothetical protein
LLETQVLQLSQGSQIPLTEFPNKFEGHFLVQVFCSAHKKNPKRGSHSVHSEVDGPVQFLQAVLQGVQILVKVFLYNPAPQSETQVLSFKNKDSLQLVQSPAF